VLALMLGCERPPETPSGDRGAMHDHTPRYGGVVGMLGDLHVEVAATPDGRVRVYLSDLRRRPLPVAGVTGSVTVTRGDGARELPLRPADDALEARTEPLPIGEVRVRVALVRDGRAIELHPLVPVGIVPGLAGLPRECAPVVGPPPRNATLPECTVSFRRMVRAVAPAPDGYSMLVAVFGHGVSIWQLPFGSAIGALDPMPGGEPDAEHAHPVDALAIRPDGREVAVAVRGSVLRYGLPDGRLVGTLARDHHLVRELAYSADGTRLALATFDDGSVQTVSADDGRELGRVRFERALTAAALASEAAVLASETGPLSLFAGGLDGPARVLESATPARAVALATTRVLAASDDGVLAGWNPPSGRLVYRSPPGAPLLALAVGPGGRVVASGAHDGTVRIHRVSDGRVERTLAWHTAPVRVLAWSGRRLVSGDGSGQLAVWKVADEAYADPW
jgi:WD40 repeat protein